MTSIGPGLFWCLFIYFAANGALAVLFQCAEYETRTRNYVFSILTAVGFLFWLGVARW